MTPKNLLLTQTFFGFAIGCPSLFFPKATLHELVHADISDFSVLLTRLLGCFFLLGAGLLPWSARKAEALRFQYGVLFLGCLLNFGLATLLFPGVVVPQLKMWGTLLLLSTALLSIAQLWYLIGRIFWLPR